MNTDAIGLMLEGRHFEALELLHSALEKAKEAFEFKSKELDVTTASASAHTCVFEVSLDQVIYPHDCSERASPDNCFRLYRHVFAVADMHGLTAGFALRKTLAIVAYNLGMFYHECGLASANDDMIYRALSYYKVSAAVVDSQRLAEQQDSDLIPFELALYNNLGHIHGVYSDRNGTSTCLDRVKETVAQFTSLGDETTAFFRSTCNSHSHLHKAPAA